MPAADVIIFDLDDWCDAAVPACLPALDRLWQASEGRLKVTLFTIPAATSPANLAEMAKRPWVELAVHGWDHRERECETWDAARVKEVLFQVPRQYVGVFKAPFWLASDAVYTGLLDAGWAVADHPRNLGRLPGALRRYVLSPNHAIGAHHHVMPIIQAHGHCPDVEGNGLLRRFEDFLALAQSGRTFAFVSEVAI